MGGNFKAFSWDRNSGSPNGNKVLLFFFPLDFLGDWNPLIRSEGCTEPLEMGECGDFSSLGFPSWDGGMWRFQLIRIPDTADATGISSIPFQAVWSWQMRWETSPSDTQICCFPLPRQHQGNINHGWIFLSCSQGHLNSSSGSPTVLEISQFWPSKPILESLHKVFLKCAKKAKRFKKKKSMIILSNSSYLLLELNWALHWELLQNSTRRKRKKKKRTFSFHERFWRAHTACIVTQHSKQVLSKILGDPAPSIDYKEFLISCQEEHWGYKMAPQPSCQIAQMFTSSKLPPIDHRQRNVHNVPSCWKQNVFKPLKRV